MFDYEAWDYVKLEPVAPAPISHSHTPYVEGRSPVVKELQLTERNIQSGDRDCFLKNLCQGPKKICSHRFQKKVDKAMNEFASNFWICAFTSYKTCS